jgi:beta-keto acid cleavage enzyme
MPAPDPDRQEEPRLPRTFKRRPPDRQGVRCRAAARAGNDIGSTIMSGGVQRSYLLHVPAGYRAGEDYPLILAFHGRGETPALLESYSDLDSLPAIIVYPRGLPGTGGELSWEGTPYAAAGVNDVAFTAEVINAVEQRLRVDPSGAPNQTAPAVLAYQRSTLGAGRYQTSIVTAAIMGSHVRVGLEDSLCLGKGQIAESNASQVRKIRGILEALSLEVATPAEAREMLGLQGLDDVGY